MRVRRPLVLIVAITAGACVNDDLAGPRVDPAPTPSFARVVVATLLTPPIDWGGYGWSPGYVSALTENGRIAGFSGGYFLANADLTGRTDLPSEGGQPPFLN